MRRKIFIATALMILGIIISSCGGPQRQIIGTWAGENNSGMAGTSRIRYAFSRFPPKAENPLAANGTFSVEETMNNTTLHEAGYFLIGADGFLKLFYKECYYLGDNGKKWTQQTRMDTMYVIAFSKDNKHMTLQLLSDDKNKPNPVIDFARQ
jgi:hypothetical protein